MAGLLFISSALCGLFLFFQRLLNGLGFLSGLSLLLCRVFSCHSILYHISANCLNF